MDYLSALRSILAHHVRQMELFTVRSGMRVSWLTSRNAKEVVRNWSEASDTVFTGDETEDTAVFASIRSRLEEAQVFLTDVMNVSAEDEELSEGTEYLRELTSLAQMRLNAATDAQSNACIALGWQ